MDWKDWRVWARGLIAAIVNGFASGIVLTIADPQHFNLSDGFWPLVNTSGVLALWSTANYLKQHPLPEDDQVVSVGSRLPVVLLALGLTSVTLAGCAHVPPATPDKARVVVYEALGAMQDAERSIYAAGQIPIDQHRAFSAALVPVLEAGLAFDRAAAVWPKGDPAPGELGALVSRLGDFTAKVTALLPDSAAKAQILAAILRARQIIDSALLAFAGGGR